MKSILVAGGQLDPNIGCLLRRILQRKISFLDILIGPDTWPEFHFDLLSRKLFVNGNEVSPTGCFVRHDVFWPELGHARGVNWFYAVKGWAQSQAHVRCFNKLSQSGEGSKIQNLVMAHEVGLRIPCTHVTNNFYAASDAERMIVKPVAGGEFTVVLSDLLLKESKQKRAPKFLQRKLSRPERRVYRIGKKVIAFEIKSNKVDYRDDPHVEVHLSNVNPAVENKFVRLCDMIGLDFAAGDFMTDADGDLVFLEVNSQPMFVAFDKVSEGAVADAIIDYLLD